MKIDAGIGGLCGIMSEGTSIRSNLSKPLVVKLNHTKDGSQIASFPCRLSHLGLLELKRPTGLS